MNFDHSFDILYVEKYDTRQEKNVCRVFFKRILPPPDTDTGVLEVKI